MHPPHLTIDLSSHRRLLVAGDIHGHLDRLIEALDKMHYDAGAGDQLILLGDLLDRGPDVLELHEWLIANPSVKHVIGNHDDMLLASLGLVEMCDHNNPFNLFRNGGSWLGDFSVGYGHDDAGQTDFMLDLIEADKPGKPRPADIVDPRILEFGRHIANAPIAFTALTPQGHTVGLVHADVPYDSWAETVAALESSAPAIAKMARLDCNWKRRRINKVKSASAFGQDALTDLDIGVTGVDHIFLGHSIVPEATTAANLTWIDTGPYRGNPITVVDVDDWLTKLP